MGLFDRFIVADFGGMKLLFQDDEGGLEIQSPDEN